MEKATIARMTREEWFAYEQSLKYERDYHNTINYAKKQARIEGLKEGYDEGIEKGIEKGILKGIEQGKAEGEKEALRKVAISMKKTGLANSVIIEILKIEESELLEILKEIED